jgi:hypothetical protein
MSLEREQPQRWWVWTDNKEPRTIPARTEGLALSEFLSKYGEKISFGETIYIADQTDVSEHRVGVISE